MIKTTLLLASSMLVLLLAPIDATSVQVRTHERSSHGHGRQHHFKETPWEHEPAVKKAKCTDFCTLAGFWAHQLHRNCNNTPNPLCMNYKLAAVGLDAVIIVAECNCATIDSNKTAKH